MLEIYNERIKTSPILISNLCRHVRQENNSLVSLADIICVKFFNAIFLALSINLDINIEICSLMI